MSYYSMTDEQHAAIKARGIDYDLMACLEYNPQPFTVGDIKRVVAVWEGENDVDDWRWVLRIRGKVAKERGKFVFLQGGCDYTGWD